MLNYQRVWDLFQAPNNFADRFLELIVEFLCDIDDIAMGRAWTPIYGKQWRLKIG